MLLPGQRVPGRGVHRERVHSRRVSRGLWRTKPPHLAGVHSRRVPGGRAPGQCLDGAGPDVGGHRRGPAHRQLGIVDQGAQHLAEPPRNPVDGRVVEPGRVVLELDVQPPARGHQNGQRKVPDTEIGDVGDPQAARRVGGVRVHRVVLQHDDGVEQVAEPGQPLDLPEAEMLVVEQVGLLGLQPGQCLRERLVRAPAHPHRQGVDEQADHRVHPGDVGAPAGDGGAEDHVRAAAQPAEDQAPGALHDRREGQAVVAGPREQRRGDVLGELQAAPAGPEPGGRLVVGDQSGRFAEAHEGFPPGLPGLRPLEAGQPAQVLAVTGDGGQPCRPLRHPGDGVPAAVRVVEREQVTQHDRDGPAVGHDVMMGDQ